MKSSFFNVLGSLNSSSGFPWQDVPSAKPFAEMLTFITTDSIDRVHSTVVFRVVLAIAAIWIALFLSLALYVAVAFVKDLPQNPLVLRALQSIAMLSTTVLFIPFTSVLFRGMACPGAYDGWMDTGWACGGPLQIGIAIVLAFLLAGFAALSLFVASVFIDLSPSSMSWSARTSGRVDVYLLLIKLGLGLIYNVVEEQVFGTWPLTVILLACGGLWFYLYYIRMPLVHPPINALQAGFALGFTWAAAALGLTPMTGSAYIDRIYIFTVGSVALGALLTHLRYLHLTRRELSECTSLYEMDIWSRSRLQAYAMLCHRLGDRTGGRSVARSTAMGKHRHAIHHQDHSSNGNEVEKEQGDVGDGDGDGATATARGADVVAGGSMLGGGGQVGVCTSTADAAMIRERAKRFGEAEQGYRTMLEQFSEQEMASLLASVFFREHWPFHYNEALALAIVRRRSPGLDIRFVMYERSRQLHEAQNGGLNPIDRVLFDQYFDQVGQLRTEAARHTLAMWEAISDPTPDLHRVEVVGGQLQSALFRADALFRKLLSINGESTVVLRAYATHLLEFDNRANKAQELLNKAERIESIHSRGHRQLTRRFVMMGGSSAHGGGASLDSMRDSNSVILISGDPTNIGEILMVSTGVCAAFGYSSAQLIGQNVSILIPSPMSEYHDTWLRQFQYRRQSCVVNHARMLLGQHRNGAIFPIWLKVVESPPDEETLSPRFSATMEPIHTDENFILFSSEHDDFRVFGASAGSLHLLGIAAEQLDEADVSLRSWFPSVDSGFSDIATLSQTEVQALRALLSVSQTRRLPKDDNADAPLRPTSQSGGRASGGLGRAVVSGKEGKVGDERTLDELLGDLEDDAHRGEEEQRAGVASAALELWRGSSESPRGSVIGHANSTGVQVPVLPLLQLDRPGVIPVRRTASGERVVAGSVQRVTIPTGKQFYLLRWQAISDAAVSPAGRGGVLGNYRMPHVDADGDEDQTATGSDEIDSVGVVGGSDSSHEGGGGGNAELFVARTGTIGRLQAPETDNGMEGQTLMVEAAGVLRNSSQNRLLVEHNSEKSQRQTVFETISCGRGAEEDDASSAVSPRPGPNRHISTGVPGEKYAVERSAPPVPGSKKRERLGGFRSEPESHGQYLWEVARDKSGVRRSSYAKIGFGTNGRGEISSPSRRRRSIARTGGVGGASPKVWVSHGGKGQTTGFDGESDRGSAAGSTRMASQVFRGFATLARKMPPEVTHLFYLTLALVAVVGAVLTASFVWSAQVDRRMIPLLTGMTTSGIRVFHVWEAKHQMIWASFGRQFEDFPRSETEMFAGFRAMAGAFEEDHKLLLRLGTRGGARSFEFERTEEVLGSNTEEEYEEDGGRRVLGAVVDRNSTRNRLLGRGRDLQSTAQRSQAKTVLQASNEILAAMNRLAQENASELDPMGDDEMIVGDLARRIQGPMETGMLRRHADLTRRHDLLQGQFVVGLVSSVAFVSLLIALFTIRVVYSAQRRTEVVLRLFLQIPRSVAHSMKEWSRIRLQRLSLGNPDSRDGEDGGGEAVDSDEDLQMLNVEEEEARQKVQATLAKYRDQSSPGGDRGSLPLPTRGNHRVARLFQNTSPFVARASCKILVPTVIVLIWCLVILMVISLSQSDFNERTARLNIVQVVQAFEGRWLSHMTDTALVGTEAARVECAGRMRNSEAVVKETLRLGLDGGEWENPFLGKSFTLPPLGEDTPSGFFNMLLEDGCPPVDRAAHGGAVLTREECLTGPSRILGKGVIGALYSMFDEGNRFLRSAETNDEWWTGEPRLISVEALRRHFNQVVALHHPYLAYAMAASVKGEVSRVENQLRVVISTLADISISFMAFFVIASLVLYPALRQALSAPLQSARTSLQYLPEEIVQNVPGLRESLHQLLVRGMSENRGTLSRSAMKELVASLGLTSVEQKRQSKSPTTWCCQCCRGGGRGQSVTPVSIPSAAPRNS